MKLIERKFLDLAIEEAKKAFELNEVPVGCVLVREDEIIAKAHNQSVKLKNPIAHAEILCFEQALKELNEYYLKGLTLYSTLEPCIMCASASVLLRISEIVFILEDEKFGGVRSLFQIPTDVRLNHNVVVRKVDYRSDEVKELMRSFFKMRR